MNQINDILEIKEYNNPNTLVMYISEFLIPDKNNNKHSLVEYICKDRFNCYLLNNNISNNYVITINKEKIKEEDIIYIDTLIEYRDTLYSINGIDMFDYLKKYTNSAWDKFVDDIWKKIDILDDKIKNIKYSSNPSSEYHKNMLELSELQCYKKLFFDGIGLNYLYESKDAKHEVFKNEDKHKARLIIENIIIPILKKEAELECYLNDYKLKIKQYEKDYLRIKTIIEEFYINNNINKGKYVNEWNLFVLTKSIYNDTIYQYSPEFLGRQKYDIFIPELNIAIEYQGIQHYEQTDYFGPLEEIQARDKRKNELSKQNKVKIIYWKYNIEINKDNFYKILKENNIKI